MERHYIEAEKKERIQKILARAGIASRRASEALIAQGRVSVNGKRARLGDKASWDRDEIRIDGILVDRTYERKYLILNKPRGVITATSDDYGRKTVLDFVPEEVRKRYRIFPVGRLDKDSTGLILLTNDGFLANRITHPRYGVPREYLVETEPVLSPKDASALRGGVELEEGNTGPAEVSILAVKERRALVRMTIYSGKKRQIRRSFHKLGYKVHKLNRVRIDSIHIGSLRMGEIRELTPREVKLLYEATGMDV